MPQTFPCFNPSCSGAFTPSSEGRHPTSSYSILCLPLLFLHLARLVWISHTLYQLLGIFRWWLATEPHPWAWLGALSQLHLHPSQIKPEAGAETQTVPRGLSPGKSPGSLFHFLWSQFTGPSPCVLMTVYTESEFFPHIHSAALWYMAFLAPCLSSLFLIHPSYPLLLVFRELQMVSFCLGCVEWLGVKVERWFDARALRAWEMGKWEMIRASLCRFLCGLWGHLDSVFNWLCCVTWVKMGRGGGRESA